MSETKWTPGPWSTSYGYSDGGGAFRQVESADETIVEHVYGDENASLITAAPDMAEALARFDEIHNEGTFDLPDDTPITINIGKRQTFSGGLTLGDFRRARSALAKARGETP